MSRKRKQTDEKDVLSATAYAGFIASPFQAWMDKLLKEFPSDPRCAKVQDGVEKLLASRGFVVEDKLLKWFGRHSSQWTVLDMSETVSNMKVDAANGNGRGAEWYQACAAKTLEFLQTSDAKVFYQAPVHDSNLGFFGIADFIIRDANGNYAIWDTKLATHPAAYHVAQLIGYAVTLESMLGIDGHVAKVGLVLGEDAAERGGVVEFSTSDLRESFYESWWAFREFHASFDPQNPPDPAEEPKASVGRWAAVAEEILTRRDDLALIARLTRSQRRALRRAGYQTMTSVARMPLSDVASVSAITRIKPQALERLHLQAKLQCQTRDNSNTVPASEIISSAAQSLAALPPDDPGDIFIDFESLPFNRPPAASEYLIGVRTRDETYMDWWSHTSDEEQQSTRDVLDFIFGRIQEFPEMHAYCYGHYERSAFLRLARGLPRKYQKLVDKFVETLLVDLYPVVKGSLCLGLPGYGLKQVEKMFTKLPVKLDVISGVGRFHTASSPFLPLRQPSKGFEKERCGHR